MKKYQNTTDVLYEQPLEESSLPAHENLTRNSSKLIRIFLNGFLSFFFFFPCTRHCDALSLINFFNLKHHHDFLVIIDSYKLKRKID